MDHKFEDFLDVKKTEISIFANVEDNVPKSMPLEYWLLNTIKPQDEDLKQKALEVYGKIEERKAAENKKYHMYQY